MKRPDEERSRRRTEGRCGYCGVHETEAGTELEIDHFKPRTAGGGDDLVNLGLLHPDVDDLRQHLSENSDGLMVALTETGAFHLERLALNRPPLIALRRSRHEVGRLRVDLDAARGAQARLRERVSAPDRTSSKWWPELPSSPSRPA